jgi:hypothetical protein
MLVTAAFAAAVNPRLQIATPRAKTPRIPLVIDDLHGSLLSGEDQFLQGAGPGSSCLRGQFAVFEPNYSD